MTDKYKIRKGLRGDAPRTDIFLRFHTRPFSHKPIKIISLLTLALLLCLAPFLCSSLGGKAMADGGNLLKNGSFQDNDGTTPADWDTNTWDNTEGFHGLLHRPDGRRGRQGRRLHREL